MKFSEVITRSAVEPEFEFDGDALENDAYVSDNFEQSIEDQIAGEGLHLQAVRGQIVIVRNQRLSPGKPNNSQQIGKLGYRHFFRKLQSS